MSVQVVTQDSVLPRALNIVGLQRVEVRNVQVSRFLRPVNDPYVELPARCAGNASRRSRLAGRWVIRGDVILNQGVVWLTRDANLM